MNLTAFERCICRKYGNSFGLCVNAWTFSEKGKSVRLEPKTGEQTVAIALDGCVFTDHQLKCDGVFLWVGPQQKAAVLVELKGASELPHAFAQLAFVKHERLEYQQLLDELRHLPGSKVIEMAFIVSNGALNKPAKEALEERYGIRVKAILHGEATTPIPDLRTYI